MSECLPSVSLWELVRFAGLQSLGASHPTFSFVGGVAREVFLPRGLPGTLQHARGPTTCYLEGG